MILHLTYWNTYKRPEGKPITALIYQVMWLTLQLYKTIFGITTTYPFHWRIEMHLRSCNLSTHQSIYKNKSSTNSSRLLRNCCIKRENNLILAVCSSERRRLSSMFLLRCRCKQIVLKTSIQSHALTFVTEGCKRWTDSRSSRTKGCTSSQFSLPENNQMNMMLSPTAAKGEVVPEDEGKTELCF